MPASLAFPAQCSSLLSYHTAAAGKSAPLPGGPFRGMLLITTKIHPLCPGGACHEKQTFQRILPKAGPPPAFCLAALHALCLSAGLHRISCRCGCRLLHRLTWLRSLVFMKIGHTPCGCGLFYAYLSSSPKAIFHSSTRSTARSNRCWLTCPCRTPSSSAATLPGRSVTSSKSFPAFSASTAGGTCPQ